MPRSFSLLLIFLSVRLAGAAVPTLPTINTNNVFVVTNSTYGASTTSANNATAINAAISAASKASGGGTVEVPGPGVYLCGPLTMKSKVNLQVDAGATLMMLAYSNWSGTTTFINGSSLSDVEISGSGTIDGQGADWWTAYNTSGIDRPDFINFSGTTRLLIQNITLQNPPTFHIMLKGKNSNVTVQNININTPYPSPNTDGFDIASTNILIQNCHISDGDDNIEIGGSSALSAWILVTNCVFGHGHGVSIGSDLEDGVHDLTVVNCVFTNTDNGIRLKSDNDRGGVVQNLNYYNLGMTNIKYAPILIYSYYDTYGNPTIDSITPAIAAGMAVASVSSKTPIWRNIVISNLTATAGQPGMIWSRTELPATNILLSELNITANGSFDLYNVRGLQIVDSTINTKSYALFNNQTVFSNSAPGAATISLSGTDATNSLAFYNQSASLDDAAFFGATALTVAGSTLSDGTSLTLPATTPVNFVLGANTATVAITGGATLNNTDNISAGSGFGPGTYTLFSYTSGSLSGTPVLGTKPAGYDYELTNDLADQEVNLIVISTNAQSGTKPAITNQPAGQSVYVGDNATFVSGASGTGPLFYQWRFNTTNIVAATNSSLILAGLQLTNAGSYSVVVTNMAGSATSSNAVLNVFAPPSFGTSGAMTGGAVVFSGSGGVPDSDYVVLASTNIIGQWVPILTNSFDDNGDFSVTNIPGANPQTFYRLQLP